MSHRSGAAPSPEPGFPGAVLEELAVVPPASSSPETRCGNPDSELGARVKVLHVLGIGMGPQHITPEVSTALRSCSYVVTLDKSATPGAHAGDGTDQQLAIRRAIAEAHGVDLVVVPDPPRDRSRHESEADYRAAVAAWHAARVERMATALDGRSGEVALLSWGDPSLYDSMVRLAEQLAGRLGCDWDVLPGISAPQLLAARHRIVLHPVGGPVHVTTARRLGEALDSGQRNVLVMLTSPAVLDEVESRPELADWQLWWSANLGSHGEQNLSGTVREVLPRARAARDAAKQADGWVMDLFLLRDGPDASSDRTGARPTTLARPSLGGQARPRPLHQSGSAKASSQRVLLLGGTSEGRALAAALVDAGVDVTSSLAGRVAEPRLPVGPVRIGGFGGVDGLREALASFDVVVDATHPFAQGMSANAAAACATPLPDGRTIRLLRLERPQWPADPAWHLAASHDEAARLAAELGERPFITVGRQELGRFIPALGDREVLARVVQAPDIELPASWRIITSRGPYTLDGERDLLAEHRADVLVTKNSGGTFTWPKMQAARQLGISCVVVQRPSPADGVPTVNDVDAALAWVLARSDG